MPSSALTNVEDAELARQIMLTPPGAIRKLGRKGNLRLIIDATFHHTPQGSI